MQRKGEARYKYDGLPPSKEALLESKKEELHSEFEEYLKRTKPKGPLPPKAPQLQAHMFKTLLADIVHENSEKTKKQQSLVVKQQRGAAAQHSGRSTLTSTFTAGFGRGGQPAAASNGFKDTARLTNGFNFASHEKSKYVPPSVLQDPEAFEQHADNITQSLDVLAEQHTVGKPSYPRTW